MNIYLLLNDVAESIASQRFPSSADFLVHQGFAKVLLSDMLDAVQAGKLKAFCPRRGVYWEPPASERVVFALPSDAHAWLASQGYSWRVSQTAKTLWSAADGKGALRVEPLQRRQTLLAMFRAEEGRRPSEGGKKGKRGALQRVVERTGIDKDTLGALLDKAIVEKRSADAFAQLAANP